MRSDRDHCASRVAVEQEEEERRGDEERRRGEEEEKEEEEEQATDIKSNNPHLAGGEKRKAGSGNVWRRMQEREPFAWRCRSTEKRKVGNPCSCMTYKYFKYFVITGPLD